MNTISKVSGLAMLCALIAAIALADVGHEHEEADEDIHEFTEDASIENGQSIYMSGQNIQGQRIAFKKGPHWMSMHGGNCVSCHGVQGEGGIVPMMCRIETPPVTYKALVGDEHGEADEHNEEPEGHAHEPYTISSLRHALKEGENPAGEQLDTCMPRWELSDEDFRDLVAYLLDLDPLEDERSNNH